MTSDVASDKKNTFDSVVIRPLTSSDEEWFLIEFQRSFMSIYINKTFYVTENSKNVLYGLKHAKEKEDWLLEAAKEEFNDYVINPKPENKAIAAWLNNIPVGALLYRELKNEEILYLAQFFIKLKYQKHGIGFNLIENLIKFSDCKRCEVLTRHQNDAAFVLYDKLGFNVGDESIVLKYGYNPMRYISFYKEIKNDEFAEDKV